MPKAVILNSRQNLRPCGSDRWVKNTIEAVKYVMAKGYTLMVSHGTKPWELALTLASKDSLRKILYSPVTTDSRYHATVMREFRLDPETTELRPVASGKTLERSKTFRQNRDRMIVAEADIIIPVSLRPGGTLDGLVQEYNDGTRSLIRKFLVDYKSDRQEYRIKINRSCINPDIDKSLDGYIIHWTRSCNSPWPGEPACEFYSALLEAGTGYPRTALATLKNILKENRLRASTRHYRRQFPAVAFSELKPSEAAELMRWRARYREMSFEPYGVAIPLEQAESAGLRRVIYGDRDVYKLLKKEDRPFFQSVGEKGFWLPEKEWRCIGDLDLNRFDQEKLIAIVWRKEEIKTVSERFPGKVISYYG